jgi:tRNA(Arg) A34 adenosine deaminase TadA
MSPSRIILSLPDWVANFLPAPGRLHASAEERMDLVLELARRNCSRKTGGPFAAAVFELESGRLIAVGLNLVVAAGCSVAHAELIALMLAQQRLGSFTLNAPGLPACDLVSSTEPCAMCLGALPWAGIRRLVCGARDEDARAIGFDEGDKPADWVRLLERRHITVLRDVRREAARRILQDYAESGGLIYNGRTRQIP